MIASSPVDDRRPWRWWLWPLVVTLASIAAMLPVADTVGGAYVDDAFARALVAFALARALNGVISVAQGTELAVQPAGVGVNFTPGEILDPVNDLVERFSWIMMLATSSLGVQKVLLSMSAWHGLVIAVVAVGAIVIAAHLLQVHPRVRDLVARLFLLLLLLRFMMPVVSLANEWVYQTFLEADYTAASESLDTARTRIGALNDEVLARDAPVAEPGLIDRAREAYRQMLSGMDLRSKLESYRLAAETVSESTIRLIVVFLMQTVVFPLLFLAIVYAVMKRLGRR